MTEENAPPYLPINPINYNNSERDRASTHSKPHLTQVMCRYWELKSVTVISCLKNNTQPHLLALVAFPKILFHGVL